MQGGNVPNRAVESIDASSPAFRRLVIGAFFLSGLAGLMHEVVWAKLIVALIGTTAYAQMTVLVAFMGGLALGAARFGRRADRRGGAVRTYVALEIATGLYCLILPLLVHLAGMGHDALATRFFESTGFHYLGRFILSLALVLFPAILMGGTLPLLARTLTRRVEETRRKVAGLYAANGLGAALGACLAGFVTLPLLGLYPSLAIASLLNFVAGAMLFGRARHESAAATASPYDDATMRAASDEQRRRRRPDPHPTERYGANQYAVALIALVLSGYAAMGYEVIFTRVFSLAFGASTYSFSVMLVTFLAGIGFGSLLMSRRRIDRPLWFLGATQLAVVVSLILVTPLIARLPYWIALLRIDLRGASLGFEMYQVGKACLCLAVLLLPTICLGFSFPLVAQIQARHPREIGTRVGSTYAWNSVGNVLGIATTALVVLPWLGVLGAFHVNLAVNFIAGAVILIVATEAGARRRVWVGSAAGLLAVVYVVAGTGWSDTITLACNHLRLESGPPPSADAAARANHPASSFEVWKRHFVVREEKVKRFFFEEDAHTAVVALDTGKEVILFVNGKPDASTDRDLTAQLLLGHVPAFLALDARSLLMIGYGSGITAGSAMQHPIERADIVEISRGVLDADPLFAHANHRILDDPRVTIYQDDGQSFLRAVPRNYDLIISGPSNPWMAGIAGLFTVEFFESMRRKLNPRGLAVVWFHAYDQTDAGVELVLRTLGSVFPNVMVFSGFDFADMIAVASVEPIVPDYPAMERRFEEPAIRTDLRRIGITNLASLLSHQAISQDRFPGLIPPGPLNTVGRQRLEYTAPRSLFRDDQSLFVAQASPLFSGDMSKVTLLDRYIAYRAAAGDPIGYSEFDAVARHAAGGGEGGHQVAMSVMARARQAALTGSAPVRPVAAVRVANRP